MMEYTLVIKPETMSVWAKSEKQAKFYARERLARRLKDLIIEVTKQEEIDRPCKDCGKLFPESRTGKDKNGDVLCFTCLGKRQTMF